METSLNEVSPKVETKKDDSYKTVQVVIFRLGTEEYGIAIDQIKEVVLTPTITKVPLSPPYIKGVANIRGSILAIVDLENKFELEASISKNTEGKQTYTLVIESDEIKVGVLVMDVPNTAAIAEKDIDTSAGILNDSSDRNYIKGIIKLQNRLIILIDIFKIFSMDELKALSN